VAAITLIQTPFAQETVLIGATLGTAETIWPTDSEQCLATQLVTSETLDERKQAFTVLKLNRILFHDRTPFDIIFLLNKLDRNSARECGNI